MRIDYGRLAELFGRAVRTGEEGDMPIYRVRIDYISHDRLGEFDVREARFLIPAEDEDEAAGHALHQFRKNDPNRTFLWLSVRKQEVGE